MVPSGGLAAEKGARESRQLVTNEPVEFEKYLVKVQDCRRITGHFRGIYRIYPNLIQENRRMSTCNRLDLQTLGSQPLMPKNLPDRSLLQIAEAELHIKPCFRIRILLHAV